MKNPNITLTPEIARALNFGTPVVALESTVITHGLPQPQNLELARDMEQQVRDNDATPATVALLDGEIRIGLSDEELVRLSESDSVLKVSHRDFATAILKKKNGGTTVAGTMFAAQLAGIKVFATGGIGGVHKESSFDISTDLRALAEIPMIVVCAGAKAILDLPATLEYLETMGVPVVGYQTDEFPAFYSRESGLNVSVRLDSPKEIADFARAHWDLGMRSAVLVTNPVPETEAISQVEMEPMILQASEEAIEQGIHGQKLTPFLLGRISELTEGKSLRTNLALLLNNARLAARIAAEMTIPIKVKAI
ncbi:pseudouridine-5'-phosphate glycosidase [Candidatus Villigracilis saccharophilus]|uniref:pseudouridine-5'-phosphate glycosidase n=1 Tax=Candidatus Villigracilis saccharophilus TaxID=3140684 RepID=UPI003135F0C6|nr:pseudouridine-5'-phosphate glycosidase [Anaerolineales bacterium]